MNESARAPEGQPLVNDGVGVLVRGDACIIVYQKPARINRTRWLFDVVDAVLAETNFDIVGFLIVLPTADPPDRPTRDENVRRLRKISHRVRRLVTTPIGNAFKVSLVRTVMRGLNILLGHSDSRFVTDTVPEGLAHLVAVKSARTPSPEQILADISAVYVALGEPEPKFPNTRPGHGPSVVPR
ncbi:MAG TPA: hypothetical protein VGQ57_17685 [Polyangiaceae bacterium]|jgi:hypothetical protein|nr:hypothetical protein [Polyangiaceae bacterium]